MVQVIGQGRVKPPSASQRLGMAFSNAAGGITEHLLNQKNLQMENEAANRLGLNLEGFGPEMRQKILADELLGRRERANREFDAFNQGRRDRQQFENEIALQKNKHNLERQSSSFEDLQNYSNIQSQFGKNVADLWRAAPIGGKTEVIAKALEAKSRGEDLNELLSGFVPPSQINQEITSEKTPQMKKGEIPKDYNWPDFSKRPIGYNPKEWSDERKAWRKENAPLFNENQTKLKNSIRDNLDIKKLSQLNKSGKLPEGMGRIIIDPETGEIRPSAQLAGLASPETQEYVKIFSRFQNRAKDAFGSRVTNFDLASYMKQFPGLLNTAEGRERILRMMSINNDLDQLYERAIGQIYKKYGLSGIPQEKADELAQSFIRDETERLENEYLNLDEQNASQSEESSQLSGRMIDVIGPDGQEYEIDQSEVGLLPEGYRLK